MALSANTVFEVRTDGADTNGGGWVTGASGTDWSQQAAAQYSVTDGVTAGTTTITSATANFGTDVVGNIMYVQGGTGSVTAGWYQITGRTNSTTITVDRSTGLTAGTGVTLNIGGALATPGLACTLLTVSGMMVWVKSGTYTMTTASAASGGICLFPTTATNIKLEGYQTTRGDRTGTMPILNWGAVSAPGGTTYMFAGTGTSSQSWHNITADGNSVANVSGFSLAQGDYFAENCIAKNCNQSGQAGFVGGSDNFGCVSCKADTCTTGFTGSAQHRYCVATACTTGFTASNIFQNCIAYACTTYGFRFTQTSVASGCVAYGTTAGAGFSVSGSTRVQCADCVSVSNSTYGYDMAATSFLMSCASYNNTSGRLNSTNYFVDQNPILCTGDPFTSSTDFRPDNTASEGALLRDAGFPVYGQTDNRDVGAVQHADPAGGGGGNPNLLCGLAH